MMAQNFAINHGGSSLLVALLSIGAIIFVIAGQLCDISVFGFGGSFFSSLLYFYTYLSCILFFMSRDFYTSTGGDIITSILLGITTFVLVGLIYMAITASSEK